MNIFKRFKMWLLTKIMMYIFKRKLKQMGVMSNMLGVEVDDAE